MTDASTSLDMSTGLRKVAERAKREPAGRFHSLAHLIDEKLLASHAPGSIRPGQAILVATGWGRMWNKPGAVLRRPNFTKRAIAWLLRHKPFICGFDVPGMESSWSEDVVEEKGGLLGMLFKKNVLLVAPLVNLEKVRADKGTLYCLPLPVAGTSGAPARVLFEERA